MWSLSNLLASWPLFSNELRSYWTRQMLGFRPEIEDGQVQRFRDQIPAIIGSMTKAEQDQPESLRQSERIGQIATSCGVATEQVEMLVRWFLTKREHVVMVDGKHGTNLPTSELCVQTHSQLIAGHCPWCGVEIYRG